MARFAALTGAPARSIVSKQACSGWNPTASYGKGCAKGGAKGCAKGPHANVAGALASCPLFTQQLSAESPVTLARETDLVHVRHHHVRDPRGPEAQRPSGPPRAPNQSPSAHSDRRVRPL